MSDQPPLTVVWFKRDLRLHDHQPLCEAAAQGRVLPLYVAEPDYWQLPDTSARQWRFLHDSLEELAADIETRSGRLCTRTGDMVSVLQNLRDTFGPFRLVAHQETGNHWTYRRDDAVRAWCQATDTPFTEYMQHGVWRGRDAHRQNWAKRWDALMEAPMMPIPARIDFATAPGDPLPTWEALGLAADGLQILQTPGRAAGLSLHDSFLNDRGEPYRTAMSSPIEGENACSRLSPHIAAGTLSIREIYQATLARQAVVAELPKAQRGTWAGALSSYVGRLHWHCHFMQKLEAEPELEWRPMARSYEGLRAVHTDMTRLEAYANGQTGYPFVDACMRYLRATGWINFRMRAMLMSFASYNLWLPWQQSGGVLARLFTDYEPGIHWPQSQMQSGETGINAVRIYSPVKQGHDQDPSGAFTRRWVLELKDLDGEALQAPWLHGSAPAGYPDPIVDYAETTKSAKSQIYAHRRTDAAKAEADEVFERHGSRKPRHLRQPTRKTRHAA